MKNTSTEYTIKPPKGMVEINFPEIWKYRELLYIFAWRDIKVRYKQTVLGIAWAIFQPLVTMVIFTAFFGRLAKIPSDGIPYPIFVYSGLLFWNYFSSSLSNASNSLVENGGIINKIYFPRLILPASTTVTPLIDFLFAFAILIGMMFYYHFSPTFLGIIMVPVLLLVSLLSSAGLGLFLTSVNVKYRDVRYILPFFIQILMYVTPIIYPISIIPHKYQWISLINPMSGVITFARALFLHTGPLNWSQLGISALSGFVLLILGLAYFKKTERYFADII